MYFISLLLFYLGAFCHLIKFGWGYQKFMCWSWKLDKGGNVWGRK